MLIRIYKILMIILTSVIMFTIGYWMDAVVELAIMLTAFLIAKRQYLYQYHCKSMLHCLLLSTGVFVICLRITLPVGVSYTCAGVCGLLVAYIAQYEAESKFIREDYAYIEPRYNAFVEEKNSINVYRMSEFDLRTYCRENLLDEIDEEITVQRLIYHLKGKQLYEKIGYSKSQMIRREQRIESKLHIKLKDC